MPGPHSVLTGTYVSLLAPENTDYIACHPEKKITTYILHVLSITTHTHVRLSPIGKKKRKEKKRKEKKRKEKKRKEKKRKEKKDKKRRKQRKERGKKQKTAYY